MPQSLSKVVIHFGMEEFRVRVGALRKDKPDDPDLVMFDGALAQRNHRSIKRSRSLSKQPSTHPSFPEAYYNWGSLLLSRRD
jgi:hypothetical protein